MTRSTKPLLSAGNADTRPLPGLGHGSVPPPNTRSLNELHNEECRIMLELVDELQTCGLGTMMSLPQLVVCGDQSSGKSSVLEALTEVPFPRNEGLCTRFATQIEIRPAPTESIRTKIIPDANLSADKKKKLSAFKKTITDFKDFGSLIEEATIAMGLKHKASKASNQATTWAFSLNVLSIEISGPERLPLTIVDLPGLIHTETAEQTEQDKVLIHGLVEKYLREEHTIALAVVSANIDLANHQILSKCRKVDLTGSRTLGIITKMDCLPSGSRREKSWLDASKNLNIKLNLGWHLLKNRADEDHDQNFADRNNAEAKFFDTGSYKDIRSSHKGIGSLRTRISDLVCQDAKEKLPKIRDDAIAKLEKVNASIKALGDKRSTVMKQRSLLMTIATGYHNIVSNAVEGHYEHLFFKAPAQDDAVYRGKFLRGATENLQEQFTKQMLLYGHKYSIPQTPSSAGTDTAGPHGLKVCDSYDRAKAYQIKLSREKAVDWVKKLHTTTQGRELPGTFNSTLVTHLFHEQSQNWEKLADEHISKVETGCTSLVICAVNHVAPPQVAKNIIERLDGILTRRCTNAEVELAKLLTDRTDPVAIYDPSFAMDVQKLLDHEHITRLHEANRRASELGLGQILEPSSVPAPAKKQDSNQMSAEKALDNLIALYSSKVKTFAANVTQQVIERNLLKGLANETLSATIVHGMSDEEISDLAAEPKHVTREREDLENQKDILEKSRKAFNKVLNPRTLESDENYGNAVVGGSKRLRLHRLV